MIFKDLKLQRGHVECSELKSGGNEAGCRATAATPPALRGVLASGVDWTPDPRLRRSGLRGRSEDSKESSGRLRSDASTERSRSRSGKNAASKAAQRRQKDGSRPPPRDEPKGSVDDSIILGTDSLNGGGNTSRAAATEALFANRGSTRNLDGPENTFLSYFELNILPGTLRKLWST
ncbi:hypothetical protein ACJJTC_007121 [Scirpophaga incertulas]